MAGVSMRRIYKPEELKAFEQYLLGNILHQDGAKCMGISGPQFLRHYNRWVRELPPEQRESYERVIHARVCPICGGQDKRILRGRPQCRACLRMARNRERQEYRLDLVSRHLCTRCGAQDEVTLNGGHYCAKCREWERKARKYRKQEISVQDP